MATDLRQLLERCREFAVNIVNGEPESNFLATEQIRIELIADLARILREPESEGKGKATDEPKPMFDKTWFVLDDTTIHKIVDKAIAEHEAKRHKCPHCGKEKG